MNRAYYCDWIGEFLANKPESIINELVQNNEFALQQTQLTAWNSEIGYLSYKYYTMEDL